MNTSTSPSIPRVSVIMPVYNCAPYLRESIESILAQTFRDFDFVIVDDGSSDGSAEIIAEYEARESRIKAVRNDRNSGLPHSLNRALSMAVGELVARQDGDDVSLPERLEKQVRFMDENPDIGVLGSQMTIVDEKDRTVGEFRVGGTHGLISWSMFFGWIFAHPSVVMRRALLESVGGYAIDSCGEDVDLWIRLSDHTRFANLRESLVRYRRHGSAYSLRGKTKQQADALRARRAFACRILGRDISEDALRRAGRAHMDGLLLNETEIHEAVGLVVDLFLALVASGRIDAAEAPAVREDVVRRVVMLSRGSREVAAMVPRLQNWQRRWRASVPQPVKALAHGLRRITAPARRE